MAAGITPNFTYSDLVVRTGRIDGDGRNSGHIGDDLQAAQKYEAISETPDNSTSAQRNSSPIESQSQNIARSSDVVHVLQPSSDLNYGNDITDSVTKTEKEEDLLEEFEKTGHGRNSKENPTEDIIESTTPDSTSKSGISDFEHPENSLPQSSDASVKFGDLLAEESPDSPAYNQTVINASATIEHVKKYRDSESVDKAFAKAPTLGEESSQEKAEHSSPNSPIQTVTPELLEKPDSPSDRNGRITQNLPIETAFTDEEVKADSFSGFSDFKLKEPEAIEKEAILTKVTKSEVAEIASAEKVDTGQDSLTYSSVISEGEHAISLLRENSQLETEVAEASGRRYSENQSSVPSSPVAFQEEQNNLSKNTHSATLVETALTAENENCEKTENNQAEDIKSNSPLKRHGEESSLHQHNSVIVQEALDKAVYSSSKDTTTFNSEVTEPSLKDFDKLTEPSDTDNLALREGCPEESRTNSNLDIVPENPAARNEEQTTESPLEAPGVSPDRKESIESPIESPEVSSAPGKDLIAESPLEVPEASPDREESVESHLEAPEVSLASGKNLTAKSPLEGPGVSPDKENSVASPTEAQKASPVSHKELTAESLQEGPGVLPYRENSVKSPTEGQKASPVSDKELTAESSIEGLGVSPDRENSVKSPTEGQNASPVSDKELTAESLQEGLGVSPDRENSVESPTEAQKASPVSDKELTAESPLEGPGVSPDRENSVESPIEAQKASPVSDKELTAESLQEVLGRSPVSNQGKGTENSREAQAVAPVLGKEQTTERELTADSGVSSESHKELTPKSPVITTEISQISDKDSSPDKWEEPLQSHQPGENLSAQLSHPATEPDNLDAQILQQKETSKEDKDKIVHAVDQTPYSDSTRNPRTSNVAQHEVVHEEEVEYPLQTDHLSALVKPKFSSVFNTDSIASTDSHNDSIGFRTNEQQKADSSKRKVTFRSQEPLHMGVGAFRDGDVEEVDPRFAAPSTSAGTSQVRSPPQSPSHRVRSSKFNTEGHEVVEVQISSDGFNIQNVTISEGQVVCFVCDQSCPNNANLLQVVYDGEELRPVIGGFRVVLDQHDGVFQQRLNLEGEYKFALSGIRCTPLLVSVKRKKELSAEVTDEGFVPDTVYVDQGTTVRWSWKETSVPHTVTEINYVFEKGCMNRLSATHSIVATITGSHTQTFGRPGVYYFRTEGGEPGTTHLCIVCVQSVAREYRVEVLDRSFQPMIQLIEEGDRVWFSWDKSKCKKPHSVYQIEAPDMDHAENNAYEPVQDGFKWATPSKQGLMSHRFDKVGVFYFSDQNFEEAAEYIGTIIVRPKQKDHVIRLQDNGLSPDLLRILTGERVWWMWDGPARAKSGEHLLLLEEDKTLHPLSSKKSIADQQTDHYQELDADSAELMTRIGASTTHFTTVGVYTYKLSASTDDNINTCSIIVNPGFKNHTVHLTDSGFEPKVITVSCNDRVWWVWQSGKRQHNIMQVSHQGLPIPGGFCSGQPRDSPSAFFHQFCSPGVYYFISKSLSQVFGAIVVSTRPQVHEVNVKESELQPDPITLQVNDVVAWVFGSPQQYNVVQVKTVDQILETGDEQKALIPRRCFAHGISHSGKYHFKSKSFQKRKESAVTQETRLSSVVCDERCDSIVVTVDKKGFHPDHVYLQKGQSLLWSWRSSNEDHNIVHVTDPESAWETMTLEKAPLNMIKGPRAFNSGRPLLNDSFLYTFDEDGSYTVVSQGAPGFSCTVTVLEVAQRASEPYISSEQVGGTVDRFTKIYLASKTSGAKIYYTLDGSRPSVNSKLYNPERGVTLREPGLNFVRAIAVCEQFLQSYIFTSKRFWVLTEGDGDSKAESLSDNEMTIPSQTKTWDWWSCKPKIKGCFTSPGTLEIFWESHEPAARRLVKNYQVFLNGVSYCPKFPSSTDSVKVVGLAGGRKYDVSVEVYPSDSKNETLQSNTLQLTCPHTVPSGGPLISLETTKDPQTLSVVWMSIDSPQQPIDGYLVYLNDQQCGPRLVPEAGSNRCKVVISGCDSSTDYKIYVLAVMTDTDETLMSNVLVVQLPLDTSSIILPPSNERMADEEIYQEYVEVSEGSGYLPQMDDPKVNGDTFGQDASSITSASETFSETDSITGSSDTDSEVNSEQLSQTMQVHQQGLQKQAEREDQDVSEDFVKLPPSSLSLQSFSDLDAYHREYSTQYDSAARDQVDGTSHTHISFHRLAGTVYQTLKSEKAAHRKQTKGMRKGRNENSVSWRKVQEMLVEEKLPSATCDRQASSKILKSVLKTRLKTENVPTTPSSSLSRHKTRPKDEDIYLKRGKHLIHSHSEETYEAAKRRYRPACKLQRGHSESYNDYYEDQVRHGDWTPPPGTPRFSAQRSDNYRDETSDCSEETSAYQHSLSSDPGYLQQEKFRSYQSDRSFDHHSHSSNYSQQRRVSFLDHKHKKAYQRDRGKERDLDIRRDLPAGYRRHRDSIDTLDAHFGQENERSSLPGRRRSCRPKSRSYKKPAVYKEVLDNDTVSDRDSVEHLYISPCYAEELYGHRKSRKSVQFFLSPIENDTRCQRSKENFYSNSAKPKAYLSARQDESLDSQVSEDETILADSSRGDGGPQYVLHAPYGDVAVYGEERDPTPPPLPEETGGMLSRFLEIVNHVPFIREDLLDSSQKDDFDHQPGDHMFWEHQNFPQESNRKDLAVSSERSTSLAGTEGHKKPTLQDGIVPTGGSATSYSDQGSEKDFEQDIDGLIGPAIIFDASQNKIVDSKHSRNQVSDDDLTVMEHVGKNDRKQSDQVSSLIQVQKKGALGIDEVETKEGGDITERAKLDVSTDDESLVQIKEGELVTGGREGLLPAPSISATTLGRHSVCVTWELPEEPDPQYKLQVFVVNIVGVQFSNEINSDISYECNLVEKGKQVRGVQHCWNIHGKQQCVIKGLQPGLTYRIYVICNYSTMRGNKPMEIQTTSRLLYVTIAGPPKAPRIRVVKVDLYQTCLAWDAPALPENARLSGYQILVNGKPLGGLRKPEIQQMVINNLMPGKTMSINVVAVMARAAQESAPSKTIHITCPRRPEAPVISQQPSYKQGSVLLAWDKPHGYPDKTEKPVTAYSIFVDGQWHGEVKANRLGDQQGYQFFLTDLASEQSYDVTVKAVAGGRTVDPDSQHVYCLSESLKSNTVPVMAPAAPKSPKLRLEGLHPDGIDVTWQTPQQSGDAHISGYQMLKNGKLYGSIIPPDVNSLRIRDVSLGEKLTLQLIALTEHPVGKSDARAASVAGDKDSGISGSTAQHDDRSAVPSPSSTRESQKVITFTRHIRANDWPSSDADVFAGERYSGCKPGPKLVVHYTGLVCPPLDVWCERVTGHSALIVWRKAEEHKAHYVPADSYQVTWWPGDRPQDEINSDSTNDDHLLISGLRPSTTYTVVVEARKMEKYRDMDENLSSAETPEGLNAFILSSKSEYLTVKTASPPDAPRNVGISATTCNSLKVAWDPPQEYGSEVIAIRIECTSLNSQDPHYVIEDLMPDSLSADITGLHEKTDYLVRVMAVTEEYFDRLPEKHKHKKLHAIPRDVLVSQEESQWLPAASIVAKTAGTEPPANIHLSQSTMTSLTLTWTPPLVYGSNKLLSQIVRWRDKRRTKPSDPEDLIVASHVSLLPTEDALTISDLVPGSQYQVSVEAVVSLKTSLNPDQGDSGIEKNRRTAHVMSKPLTVWTRAPVESPRILVQSYDQISAVLYWEKPMLVSVIGKDEDGNPRYLRRYLEGYRLEINDKLQSCLGPQAQTCTLTKCKPGKPYSVVLIAMTCTEDRRRERKEKFKGYFKTTTSEDPDYVGLLEDDLLDQSPSESVEVRLPKTQDGFLETLKTSFNHEEERDSRTFGDIEVEWTIQGSSKLLKQFSVIWFSSEDRVIQTKYVGPEKRRTTIPVLHLKSVYTITVEPCYYTDVLPQQPQDVHIMIPGPPDAPEIFLRSQDADEFIIEWGEPRCYGGVKVKGYQVFLNDKKVGNELNSTHRKAVIPCRMNKVYRINLVALSSNPDFPDSPKSNTLLISSGKGGPDMDSSYTQDDHDLPVKITGITESSIQLDWSAYVENEEVAFYKVQWSSVAQPAQREVRLSPRDVSCIINKCLPGTAHFIRLVAYNDDGQILEKSKQLTVQTSAPPDAPVLSIRACNFRYIAIQWEKPTTYGDALISGYKVYVNGIVEAVLNSDSLSYTFTQGKWCQEYSFQVQALTAGDSLNSKPSEPLVVTWPGSKTPQIRRIPSVSSSSLRVAWNPPYLTEGVKVKHFKLCCVEEDTEKLVQSVGPIHPDTCEAEFKNLKKGNYMVYLETHLHGTGEVVRSDPIRMQPSVCPDPPQISVTVVGMEERRQLDKVTCDLANKRDRLIRAVGHKLKRIGALSHPLRAEKDQEVLMGSQTLTGVEEMLESCFLALENYTGQLIAHLSWQCPQTNEDIQLSGFKVLVDGKQYGSSVHAGVRTVRLQLGLEQPSYALSMVALSDKPQGSSVESSAVDLLSAPFRPFAYYCYSNLHAKGIKWPSQGCCKYQDALSYERQVGKKLANQGLLNKQVPPPACNLLDIFSGDYKPLMGRHQPHCPTILLFWTPWCQSSQKVMDYYIRFSREASKEFSFVAVSCGVSGVGADDRQALVHQLTSSGWREDGVMWHCTSECASNVQHTLSSISHFSSSLRVEPETVSEKYMDLTELLGIAGVPTFLFIHPDGYISWHGRYCSFDYAAFSAFMRHTNSEVMHYPCPVFNCDCCKNDMTFDQKAIEALLPEKVQASSRAITIKTLSSPNDSETNLTSATASHTDLRYTAINGSTENGTDRMFTSRKTSPKRKLSPRRRAKLSINQRPYSASATQQQQESSSPYHAKVVPATTPSSRSRSRPISAKLVHYM